MCASFCAICAISFLPSRYFHLHTLAHTHLQEVLDLTDGGFIADTRVRVGTPQEAGQCDVVVITAGAKQRPGETRLELIGRNFQSISCE